MSAIRSKNTQPELNIRKIIWSRGKRYRIHDHSIFGNPDISNKSKRVAVFLDGCFWHGCEKCYSEPKTNSKFWKNKIKSNKVRRNVVISELKKENWKVLAFWEHEIRKNPERVANEIVKKL